MNKPTTEDAMSWMSRHMTPKLFERARALSARLRDAILLRDSQPKPEPGYWDGVRKLDSDADLEIFISIQEVAPNARYLTMHRNKPRPASTENLYYLVDLPKPPAAPVS